MRQDSYTKSCSNPSPFRIEILDDCRYKNFLYTIPSRCDLICLLLDTTVIASQYELFEV